MSDKKTLATISVHTDDHTGMHYVGEADGSFDENLLQQHVATHGSAQLLQVLAYCTWQVVQAQRAHNTVAVTHATFNS